MSPGRGLDRLLATLGGCMSMDVVQLYQRLFDKRTG